MYPRSRHPYKAKGDASGPSADRHSEGHPCGPGLTVPQIFLTRAQINEGREVFAMGLEREAPLASEQTEVSKAI